MNHFHFQNKKFDLIFLLFLNIFAIFISLYVHASFLFSTILFLGLPALFLCVREKKYLDKILFASLSFGLLFGFCFDFVAELNKAWGWNGGLYFGKIAGIVQVDVMFWFFLWILHIFVFYEHFIDKNKLRDVISEKAKDMFQIGVILVAALMLTYKFAPQVLIFPKAYLVLCIIGIIPFILMFIYKPKTVLHNFNSTPYFFFVYISHEITALKLDQWNFPGDYVGVVNMLGVSFPLEELLFWIIMSSLVGSTFYEFMFDNSRN